MESIIRRIVKRTSMVPFILNRSDKCSVAGCAGSCQSWNGTADHPLHILHIDAPGFWEAAERCLPFVVRGSERIDVIESECDPCQ